MHKYWFTWGYGQEHPGCYTVVEAEDAHEARAMMYARCGYRWSMMYDDAEACGVEEYHLKYLPFDSFALPSDDDFLSMLLELLDLEHGLSDCEIDQLDALYSWYTRFGEFTLSQRAFIRTAHEKHVR